MKLFELIRVRKLLNSSAQQLVGSSLSYYLHNYVYLYAKWAASFRSATSCTTYTTPYIIHTNTSKSEKWILVASSTVYVRLARLGSSRSMWGRRGNMDGTPVNFTFTASLHGCVIDTKPKLKERVYSYFWTSEDAISPYTMPVFLLYE